MLELKQQVVSELKNAAQPLSVQQIAESLSSEKHVHIFKILERLAALGVVKSSDSSNISDRQYSL